MVEILLRPSIEAVRLHSGNNNPLVERLIVVEQIGGFLADFVEPYVIP